MTASKRRGTVGGATAPALESGLTCLQVPDARSPAFHEIVLPTLTTQGLAYWVDARNVASTYRLYELARTDRLLSGLRIARAFTAYQHFSLCRALLSAVSPRTELVCLPNLTCLYRDSDVPEHERDRFLDAVLAGLRGLAADAGIPVLVSTTRDDALAGRVHDAASRCIRVETTEFGFRYEGDGIETTVYRDGAHWQTTIQYWVDLYGAVDESSLIEAAVASEFAGVA